ncbi:DUF4142 domain-containing protein [Bordetella sputigena]|uniref:DUF4142 domain-containing protein n=1 Tax=Bordetella sputigena TaxID=1416810 RepID=UPI0039EE5DC1
MKYWLPAISLSMCFMAWNGGVHAQESDRGDAAFMASAAQAGAFEIAASQLALRKAEHDEVKGYARTMLREHADVAKQLQALAASRNVALPSGLSTRQQAVMDSLQARTGASFDRQYADDIAVAAHQEAVGLFVDAAEHGKDPEIKAFAQQTLPNLKAHLDAGMALRKSLAASGKASPEARAPGADSAMPGTVSPASREAPPTLLPGDKGAPRP